MPVTPPPGMIPLFLRGNTCEKYGMKTGPGVMDLVDSIFVPKADILKEIKEIGVMSDFEPSKKLLESSNVEKVLIIVDPLQKYGETFILCITERLQLNFIQEKQEKDEQLRILLEQEAAQVLAEQENAFARQNATYIDKPMSPHPWMNKTTFTDTDAEIKALSYRNVREKITMVVTRPKRQLRQNIRLTDRKAENVGVAEFRAYKDPAFKQIKENDTAIQVAPTCSSSSSQTTWYRSVNKAVQYEKSTVSDILSKRESIHGLLVFLESATIKVERALQQNETIDIYHEAFRMGEDESLEDSQAENELREIKNFADPTYSKSKALMCIDWMPKSQGLVAVSAVRNITYDQRLLSSGQTNASFVLLWDFRQLVKPSILLQCHQEVVKFRFNKYQPTVIVGGCLTGQVVLWDISEAFNATHKRSNQNSNEEEDEEYSNVPVQPKFTSTIDHSHRKPISDLFWLPPTTQINFKGQLVPKEHLDGKSHQFITIGGDGAVMVWDTRFENISADEVRHVGRAKHVPTEKAQKDGVLKPLWAPIFRAQLKKSEGIGELSLSHVCSFTKNIENWPFTGDSRSHLIMSTDEGEIIVADLSAKKSENIVTKDDDDEDGDSSRDFIKWTALDHPRPTVSLQESPFFPDIFLSVGDWNFHIWRVGDDRPLYRSPMSSVYLTCGCWSPSRPAVVIISTADGQLHAWDFTDSSFKPFLELKATHSKITSLEFLISTQSGSVNKQQLLAVGDETGTLHVFESPRALSRPIHKEDVVMSLFLDREAQRNQFMTDSHMSQSSESPTRKDPDEAKFDQSDSPQRRKNTPGNKKDEEDFAALEAQFIASLGLTNMSEIFPAAPLLTK